MPRIALDPLETQALSERINKICDQDPRIPSQNKGRAKVLAKLLNVTAQSSRVWLTGGTRPRPEIIGKMAEVFNVDHSWLSLGVRSGGAKENEKNQIKVSLSSSVYYTFGSLALTNAQPAFLDDSNADLGLVIQNKFRKFSVFAAVALTPVKYSVELPLPIAEGVTVLVTLVLPTGKIRMLRLTPELENMLSTTSSHDTLTINVKDEGSRFTTLRREIPMVDLSHLETLI